MAGRPNNQAAIQAKITGLREAKAAFQRLPAVARDAMNVANEVTAQQIVVRAKARLEASPSIITRNLYNHVRFTVNTKNGTARVGISAGSTTIQTAANFGAGAIAGRAVKVKGVITAGVGGSASKARGARVDVPARRAHFVEFGTVHMPAEPFMVPAAEGERASYLARCRAAGKAIERDMSRVGGQFL